MHSLLVKVWAISFCAQALATDLCAPFACLASNTDAAKYCTSALASINATTTVVYTTVVNGAGGIATSDVILTSLVTTGGPSTIYDATYITSTISATVTGYTSSAVLKPRSTQSTCDDDTAETALSSLSAALLSSACSCIDAIPTVSYETVTVTKTIATGQSDTTTFRTGIIALTVADVTTEMSTFTTTVTATSTALAAAPTYTQVYGPTTGCADISFYNLTETTMSTEADAVSACQSACSDSTECESVFIQKITYGPIVWECYLGASPFNTSDVQCGRSSTVYGTAVAYDAVGRGSSSITSSSSSTSVSSASSAWW